MDNFTYNEKEQYFSEYFNLRRRKKEFALKEEIKLPDTKKYFKKTREYLKGESEDIRAIADYIAYDEINYNKNNIGYNIGIRELALDGAQESATGKAARIARKKAADAIKKKAAAAIKKRIFRRVAIRVTTQSLNAILSTLSTVFGVIVTILFLAFSVLLWLVGIG